MIWLWFTGGLFLIMFGTVFVMGALLPRDHVASRSILLKQTPEQVWEIVRTVDALTEWRSGLTKVDGILTANGSASAWVEHSGKDQIKLALESEDHPRRFITRIDDDSLPFGGSWTYELTQESGGTRLRITEAGFVKPPPFRFIAKFFLGYTKTMEGYLADLARKTGNAIQLEP